MKKPCLMLVLIYLSGIAAPINQFKVPPMMKQLMADFDMSLAASGWLMSAFALAGFLFALPSGLFLQKIGVKRLGVTALTVILGGSVLGGLSGSVAPMLISRAVEGAGMSLLSVAAPAAISAWFPPEKRGIPVGIWATWVPAGNVVIFTAAPFVAPANWQHAWLFAAIYTAILLILFSVLFKMPARITAPKKQSIRLRDTFGAIDAWKLALIFMLFNVVTISIKTYMPAFLETVRAYSQAEASSITTIMMVCSMTAAPLAGIISDRIHSRKKLIIAACIGACIAVSLMFNVSGLMVMIPLVFIGIAGGAMPAGVFTAATELSNDPAKSGAYMSVIIFGQYLGMFTGPIFFSNIADSFGWWTAAYALIPLIILMFIITGKLKIK